MSEGTRRGRSWLTRNVVALGVVSLLTDTANEMIVPLLPHFVGTVLGGGAHALGWIEGLADLLQNVLKLVTGRIADRLRRNKPFVLFGYGLSSLARPLVALASAPIHVLLVRLADRTGKGIRTTPRDAILVGSVPAEARGRAFGFHRAMDHAGSVLGPLLAFMLLRYGAMDLKTLFMTAIVPGILTVIVIVVFVKEAAPEPAFTPVRAADGMLPDPELRRFLAPLFVFASGVASDVFLLFVLGESDVPLEGLPLVWMALHVVKSLSSLVGGRVADRFGARKTLALGWSLHVAFFVAFAFVRDLHVLIPLAIAYGVHTGFTEGPEKSYVSTLAPLERKGIALGWYYFTTGTAALPASVLFGYLFDHAGQTAAFLTGAAVSGAGLALLTTLHPPAPEGGQGSANAVPAQGLRGG